MNTNSLIVPGIVLGVTVAGLIAGSYTLFSTRIGKRLKRNLAGKYTDIRENIDDFIESLNDNVLKNLDKRSANLSKQVKKAVEFVRDEIDTFSDARNPEFRNGFMMGIALGGLLGAGALFLIQSNFSEEGADYIRRLGTKASKWKRGLEDVLEAFEETASHVNGSTKKHHHASPVNEAIHLAQAGYNLWNGIKKR